MTEDKHIQPPLVLVDGSSYLFRAFHALPPLTTTGGQATGAVKGVINMIRRLIKDYPDSPVAVVFDAKGKTFRSDLYEEYKAHRPPMPDDLRTQIEPIHSIIRAMGLPLIVEEGVEADDVIGTLARQAWEEQRPTVISTGDKDLAQLVNEHVTLLNTMTDEKLDVEGVKRKFELPPERIIDYLALMGDKSDNIPGVPGVGPKTAVKWLQEYDSVANLIEHADEIKGKAGERLRENIPLLKLSYELATIKLDVPLEFGPGELVHGEADKEALLALYTGLEFRSWIKELESEGVELSEEKQAELKAATAPADGSAAEAPDMDVAQKDLDYTSLNSNSELKTFLKKCQQAPLLGFSLETGGGHYKEAAIIGVGLSCEPGKGVYIPLAHDYVGVEDQLERRQVLELLKPLFEDRKLLKAGHDLKFAMHVLGNYGIDLKGGIYDLMLQSYVLNSVTHRHTLEKIAETCLGVDKKPLEEYLGKGRNKLSYAQLDIASATDYAAGNADLCLRCGQVLDHQLSTTGQLQEVYRLFELALVPVLAEMEETGVKVDVKVLSEQSAFLGKRLEELKKEAFRAAGEEFNLDSPKQLQAIFYEKLDYPVIRKTPKGQPSTAEPVLQELALDYELPRIILENRGLSKLKSTYTDKLPLDINPATGRIHSRFQQAVAATGRLSSTDPNLQNIPIRTEEGRRIRKAFVAEEGYMLMAADYSQVELRIMAHLSRDEGLLAAFEQGLDVHRATAAEIFGEKLEAVTGEQRRSAKAINFGLIYGMSAFGLGRQLGIARGEAQRYVERYFERYPGVKRYMDETREQAREQGYVETVFGRRLYLPDIKASNAVMRQAAERTAINAPMQGTAADIIKHAMVDIHQWLHVAGLDARMVLQVHDELIFEITEADRELLAEGVKFRMMSAASLRVPLVVDLGYGPNWDEAH